MSTDTPAAGRPPGGRLRFGAFELDLDRGCLAKNGADIPLRRKSFALLAYFAAHPGRLLSKDELMAALWPGVVVTEDSLVQCVGELRAALDDRGQQLIKTVPRRGYRFDATVERVEPSPAAPVQPAAAASPPAAVPAPSRRFKAARPALLALLLLGCAALGATLWAGHAGWPSRTGIGLERRIAAQRAIAILPFADLSGQPSPAFVEAVAEDLSIAIAHLNDTVVFAPASTARLGPKADVREVGRLLAATHVLGGSVEHDGGALRVRAQLSDSASGALLWSERFEYGAAERWTLQRDLAQRIANVLDTRLHDAHLPPSDLDGARPGAAEATLQAMFLIRHIKGRDDLLKARALLDGALKANPDSAPALTWWGLSHILEVSRRWSPDRQAQIALASQAFERALRLRPGYAMASFGRSVVASNEGRFDDALRACEDVFERWPNEPRCLQRLGMLRLQVGRPAEVAAPVQLALRLNPLEANQVAWGHIFLGMAQFHLRHDDAAYEELQKAAAADANNAFAWQWMAAIDALHGRGERARANLATYQRILPGHTISSLKATESSRNADFWAERERLYAGLRLAGVPD
ncbi:MAG: winged helix-turn-helix domain-containing protein [Rubrivivax sp.]